MSSSTTTKRFYRVAEIASKGGPPASSIYDAIRRGEIEALRLGTAIYVPAYEARRLLGEPPAEATKEQTGGGEAA